MRPFDRHRAAGRGLCILAAMLSVLLAAAAAAQPVGYRAAVIPGLPPLPAAIWYPAAADAPVAEVALGPYRAMLAADAPLAAGQGRRPVVAISHGTGGGRLSHHDTAAALARAGMVALAITHAGDNVEDASAQGTVRLMATRAANVSRALDWLFAQAPEAPQLDPRRVGVFGYSAGGATALILAGGVPEPGALPRFCRAHAGDPLCALLPRFRDQDQPAPRFAPDPRVRAAVIAAPGPGILFAGTDALAMVSIPIQLWRPEADRLLRHPHHAEAIRGALPVPPEVEVVPGAGHYAFLAPCPPPLRAAAPEVCADQPGFDRAAFHERFNAKVAGFFQQAFARLQ
ncbi:dienelactone hydrolase [Allostella vacuolata]|nr:dienelactone hydrolase [Stella vacuolata]